MDVNGSEWNDEQMVVRMWGGGGGYIWRGQGIWCYHGYKPLNMVFIGIYYCNIT